MTLGLAPLAGGVSPWLARARRWGQSLYDFEGVRAFKAKLRPSDWAPIYLPFPEPAKPGLAILDTLTAFARGNLLRFGLRRFLRGPAFVVRLLAALLVVWVVSIALAAPTWFPSAEVRWAWAARRHRDRHRSRHARSTVEDGARPRPRSRRLALRGPHDRGSRSP